ncbi:MAG: M48 family metalloprotease [Gemmatimonadota bacterium]
MKRVFVTHGLLAAAIVLGPLTAPCAAQGFNLFTVQQDVDLGRQSAIEAERQLTLLNDLSVDRDLNQIIQKLAAVAPGARYPYLIKAVNAAEINAFALPGGPMYVNRGLLAAARNEAELAGVLAHEMSHVALRHGTNQASKAYLGQAGLGILGGLLGKNGGSASQIVNAIGGFGLNAAFLTFSRDDEADRGRFLGAGSVAADPAGDRQHPTRAARRAGRGAVLTLRDLPTAERVLHDSAPGQLARVRGELGIRGVVCTRWRCRGPGQRPAGPWSTASSSTTMRPSKDQRVAWPRACSTTLCAVRGQRLSAGNAGGRDRRPRPADSPFELVPPG